MICLEQKRVILDLESSLSVLRQSDTRIARDYHALKDKYAQAQADLAKLEQDFKRICGQVELLRRDKFCSSSESEKSLIGTGEESLEDPLSEDTSEIEAEGKTDAQKETSQEKKTTDEKKAVQKAKAAERRRKQRLIRETEGNGRKKAEPGKTDYSKLPHTDTYDIDFDQLDASYGKENWEIAGWHTKEIIHHPVSTCYVEAIHTPIIKVLNREDESKKRLVSIPRKDDFYKYSHVSRSLLVYFYNEKYFKGVPFYTVSEDLANSGLLMSRQTITNVCEHFALELLAVAYNYFKQELVKRHYGHCDETYFLVLREPEREATSLSFMWVRTSGELDEEPPVVVFEYSPTRNTDNLRNFYAGFSGALNSDAYISYFVLARESNGGIKTCLCLAHARRKFADACKLIKSTGQTDEQLLELPEFKALHYFGLLFSIEDELKCLDPESRLRERKVRMQPIMNQLYQYIESLDQADPGMSFKLKEAINYTINNREGLSQFLSDGRVPIDNQFAENCIRPFDRGRRRWLFANTPRGAEASAIVYSIIETAVHNGANPQIYLHYLLEKTPAYLDLPCTSDKLAELAPYSEVYRAYEKSFVSDMADRVMPQSQTKPYYRPWKTISLHSAC